MHCVKMQEYSFMSSFVSSSSLSGVGEQHKQAQVDLQ